MKYFILFVAFSTAALARPRAYTELVSHVITAPDQAESGTCLFVASTGALEILLNQRDGLVDQEQESEHDLSETFLIHQKAWNRNLPTIESAVMKFNHGTTMHATTLPFDPARAWQKPPGFSLLERRPAPSVKVVRLFNSGGLWDTNVLTPADVEKVKQALWKHKSPVLLNYNENRYWHVVNIVGYDDDIEENCHGATKEQCEESRGVFYVRDHWGDGVETRDTDWLRVMGNAAVVVKLAD